MVTLATSPAATLAATLAVGPAAQLPRRWPAVTLAVGPAVTLATSPAAQLPDRWENRILVSEQKGSQHGA